MTDYTASAIRILPEASLKEKFFFLRVNDVARRYPHVSTEFVARLLESCQYAGFPEELAIRRYLEKDLSIQVTAELIECHKALLENKRVPEKDIRRSYGLSEVDETGVGDSPSPRVSDASRY
jgi:hypothetical protein